MNYESENFISLQEAAKYCDYSQEYLSLRARQGKLKSIKLGRNWVTKMEWLKDYLEQNSERANGFVEKSKPNKNFPSVIFALIFLLFFFVAILFLPLQQKSLNESQLATISVQSVLQTTAVTFLEYWQWLRESIGQQFVKIKTYVNHVLNPGGKKLVTENENKGMVVVPSTEKDELLKEKIKMSFSDEVKVEPTDDSSGIIIPIFREKEGDKYFYIMVPVKK